VDLRLEHESFGVYQQVALSPLHLLASIVAALFSAYTSRLDRLAIHYACAGLGVPLEANPHPLAHSGVHPLPGAVQAELPEVVVDAAPRRKVVGEQAPRTAAPYDVEDGVEYLTQRVDSGTSGGLGSRKVGLQAAPFGIGEVGLVCLSHAC